MTTITLIILVEMK